MVKLVVDVIVPLSSVVNRTKRKNAKIFNIRDAIFDGRTSNLDVEGCNNFVECLGLK
jgi:hypothetical protein